MLQHNWALRAHKNSLLPQQMPQGIQKWSWFTGAGPLTVVAEEEKLTFCLHHNCKCTHMDIVCIITFV